ncbi:hypothetical protein [Candidatus Vondammii sp. HM_W22]|uniref:hypothetical protein n=1 Tax=Candidatus Vondammii sp. HM_W22 TaxID=2687299 RepID=UPI001F1294BE|nr:hypothetical protein [Candidatus Vondammii sp. HM_W22]
MMGLGSEFITILKDTVKLTDSVKRLNGAVVELIRDVKHIDNRVVRLETLVEVAKVNQGRIESE